MRSSFPDSPEFQKLLAGGERPSLARIALEIARDAYPELDFNRYLDELAEIAERVQGRCEAGSKPRKVARTDQLGVLRRRGLRGEQGQLFRPPKQLSQ